MYFLGDPHGHWAGILAKICNVSIPERSNIIIPGDAGNGFAPLSRELENLQDVEDNLRIYNVHVWMCRGNHDDPKFFDGSMDLKFPHIHFVKDYEVVEIEGMRVLFVGGATSIDRALRREGISWWPNEVFELRETDAEPDIVVTHTAPSFCQPMALAHQIPILGTDDRSDVHLVVEERELCKQLYENLKKKPRLWVYGHFHNHYFQVYDKTEFRGLAIMELFEFTKDDLDNEIE